MSVVGIVVVSHSVALAEAAVALAKALLPGRGVRVAVAAGTDDGGTGTDATAVMAAVTAADAGGGVLVLCDLGSAVLSAETALELLDPDLATRVTVSPGPLVEGLVAAVAAASAGAELSAAAAAAERALDPKRTHLGDLGTAAKPNNDVTPALTAPGASIEVVLTLGTPDGLHARPAAQLMELVTAVDAELAVTNLRTGAPAVDGGSMLELMTLDARAGDRLRLVLSGPEAPALVGTVVPLLTRPEDLGVGHSHPCGKPAARNVVGLTPPDRIP